MKPSFDQIADKYGSDKGNVGGPGHRYGRHYEELAFGTIAPFGRILEIGVLTGASLRMWEDLFPNAEVFGIDYDPQCSLQARPPRTRVFIGNQADPAFLVREVARFGPFDLIVDDGSHSPGDICTSLGVLWEYVKRGSCYVVEDVWWEHVGAVVDAATNLHPAEVIVRDSAAPHRHIIFVRKPE